MLHMGVRPKSQQQKKLEKFYENSHALYQILSVREPREWRRPMAEPLASWLQQVNQHLKEMGLARHLPGEWPDGGPWSPGFKSTQ